MSTGTNAGRRRGLDLTSEDKKAGEISAICCASRIRQEHEGHDAIVPCPRKATGFVRDHLSPFVAARLVYLSESFCQDRVILLPFFSLFLKK